ncbi:hypothetical protein [Paenibacillus fonticola]|uniref:hypothetical protein n=1 Tax=Paenibacillus fonticola TaxID=379896 RepID=UPI000374AF5F|nr:hypothetical protein [Paenibacillus fonticola]
MAGGNQKDGRENRFLDIDRMVNEGLGGGNVTMDNGLIEETTTDTMELPESVLGAARQNDTNSDA